MADVIGTALFSRRTPAEGADVVFEVGDDELKEDIWAHSIILVARSCVMEAQLNGRFREASERRIRVLDVHPRPFLGFLEVVYKGAAKILYDVPPFLNEETAVCVTNITASPREWRDMVVRSSMLQHLSKDGDGVMYTTSLKSSGRIEAVWFGCSSFEDAKAVADKIDKQVGHTDIVGMRNIEFVLDIAVLFDRYAINDSCDWVMSHVRKYVGLFSNFLFFVMHRAWTMSSGSVFRAAILGLCEQMLAREWEETMDDGKFWDAWNNWLERLTFPLHPPLQDQQHTALQVRLQLLHWCGDLVTRDLLRPMDELLFVDRKGLEKCKRTISDGIQRVIDCWSGEAQNSNLARKRRRLFEGAAD